MDAFRRQTLFADTGAPVRTDMARTVPGMAHFAGSGPEGASCGGCLHWRGSCLQFARMMPAAGGIAVAAETPACRYFEPTLEIAARRDFTLAIDDAHYRAELASGRFVTDLRALADTGYRAGAIVADPPWPFAVRSERGKQRSAERHYATMTIEAIAELGPLVRGVAARDCVLFLWVTQPTLFETRQVIESWGFQYRTIAFTWAKTTLAGKAASGLGYWSRAGSEVCLLAARGRPKRIAKNVPQLLLAPRRAHSEKPIEIHHRIQRLVAGPFLELFARETVLGWTAWGTLEGVPA